MDKLKNVDSSDSDDSLTNYIPCVSSVYSEPSEFSSSEDEEQTKPTDTKWANGSDTQLMLTVDLDSPFNIYSAFITNDIIDLIVDETNKYAAEHTSKIDESKKQKNRRWKPTSRSEMRKLFAVLLVMGVVQVPEISLYWSRNDIYSNYCIKKAMARERFLQILKYWHFCDSTIVTDDQLNKFRFLLEKLNVNFKNAVFPGKDIVVDVPWRGSLLRKYGVKICKLCLPEGYTYRIHLYSGKDAHPVIMDILDGMLDQGRVLYVDKFYTSFKLTEELQTRNTFLCGTVRNNCTGLPVEIMMAKQKCGELLSREINGIKIMKWTGKKPITMLTTCKEHRCILLDMPRKNRMRETMKLPDVLVSYNTATKGVNLPEQVAAYYYSLRKTVKWYKKIVMELLFGTALVNAWIIHKKFSHNAKLTIHQFRDVIIDELLREEKPAHSMIYSEHKHHRIRKIVGKANKVRKRCKECYKRNSRSEGKKLADLKTKRVTTYCEDCDGQPPLCLDCFNCIHAE